jgi:uncharacterized cupin superfamily protein
MSSADKERIVVTRGVASAAHRAARHGRTGEVLGEVLSLIDDPRWTVDHVRLAAGQRSAPAHRHSHTDECVLVLSGRVELRGERVHEALEAGDFARIGPGAGTMHELVALASAELLLVRVTDPNDVTTFE